MVRVCNAEAVSTNQINNKTGVAHCATVGWQCLGMLPENWCLLRKQIPQNHVIDLSLCLLRSNEQRAKVMTTAPDGDVTLVYVPPDWLKQ